MSIVGCWLNFPLREKKGKDDFDRVIKKCIDKASKLHVKKVKVDIFVWWEIGGRFPTITDLKLTAMQPRLRSGFGVRVSIVNKKTQNFREINRLE